MNKSFLMLAPLLLTTACCARLQHGYCQSKAELQVNGDDAPKLYGNFDGDEWHLQDQNGISFKVDSVNTNDYVCHQTDEKPGLPTKAKST
jgi:hypothetical protein